MIGSGTLLFVGWDLDEQPTTGYGKPLRRLFNKLCSDTQFRTHTHYAFYPRRSLSRERLSDLRQACIRGVPYEGTPQQTLASLLAEIGKAPDWAAGDTQKLVALDDSMLYVGQAEAAVVSGPTFAVPETVAAPQTIQPVAAPMSSPASRDSTPIPQVIQPVSPAEPDHPSEDTESPGNSGSSDSDASDGEASGSTSASQLSTSEPNSTDDSNESETGQDDSQARSSLSRRQAMQLGGGIALAVALIAALVSWSTKDTSVAVDASPEAAPEVAVSLSDAAPPIDATPPGPKHPWSIQLLLPMASDEANEESLVELLKMAFEGAHPQSDSFQKHLGEANIRVIDERAAERGQSPEWSRLSDLITSDERPSGRVRTRKQDQGRTRLAAFVRRLEFKRLKPEEHSAVVLLWPSDAVKGWKTIPKALHRENRGEMHLYVLYERLSPTIVGVRERLSPDAFIDIGTAKPPELAKQLIERIHADQPDACTENKDPLACVVQAESNMKREQAPPNTQLLTDLCDRDGHPLRARACAVLGHWEEDDRSHRLLMGCEGGVLQACQELVEHDKNAIAQVLKVYERTCREPGQLQTLDACMQLDAIMNRNSELADWTVQLPALARICQLLGRQCDDYDKLLKRAITVTLSIPDEAPMPLSSTERAQYAYQRFRELLLTETTTRSLKACWSRTHSPANHEQTGRVTMEVGFRDYKIYVNPPTSRGALDDCVNSTISSSDAASWAYDLGDYSWSALLHVDFQVVAQRIATAEPRHLPVSRRRAVRPARKFKEHLWEKDARYDWQERMARCWAVEPGNISSLTPVTATFAHQSVEWMSLEDCWKLQVQSLTSKNSASLNSCVEDVMKYEALDYCERVADSDPEDGTFTLELRPKL